MRHYLVIIVISFFSLNAGTSLAVEKIDLPPFEPATIKIDGDQVPIHNRSFNLGLSLADIAPDTLPKCATQTVARALQALTDGNRDAFIASVLDPTQANNFAEAIEKKSEEKLKTWSEKVLRRVVVGEIKVKAVTIVVTDSNHEDKSGRAIYFTTPDDGQPLMIAVPYYLLEAVAGLRIGAGEIAKQLKTGELSFKQLDD